MEDKSEVKFKLLSDEQNELLLTFSDVNFTLEKKIDSLIGAEPQPDLRGKECISEPNCAYDALVFIKDRLSNQIYRLQNSCTRIDPFI